MKDRIKYEKPKLISLTGDVGLMAGDCEPGSGATEQCFDGTGADGNCGGYGYSPGGFCFIGVDGSM